MKEMSEGLFEDVPSADDGSGQDSDVAAYKQPIRADNRRTAKQKRKEKERKEEVCSLRLVIGCSSSVLC